MDKITRIHLAKIPYEIGVNAQAELKEYLDEVRSKLDSDLKDEVMEDIEHRITEILSDRKVARDGVITSKDIDAIKEQLGSPEQFSSSETPDSQGEDSIKKPRKLLRDGDGAIVGGVASGLGAYFGIDPIFVRIAFVLLTFLSGFGIALYLLLWLLVPVAKTSSDKLKMAGQPVTAKTLQKYRASVGNTPNVLRSIILKVFKIVVTVFSVLAGLHILAVLSVVTGLSYVYPFRPIFSGYKLDYLLLGLLWLICLSVIGLLITLIVRVWGKSSSRLKISAISATTALVVAVASSAAVGLVVFNHFSNQYGNGKTTTALAVNNETPATSPTQLVLTSTSDLDLTYVITNQAIHATYQAYPGLGKPNISIVNNKGTLTVNSYNLQSAAPNCLGGLCRHIYLPIHATLYGPALKTITDNNGASLIINNANLGDNVSVNAANWSQINLENDYASSLNISVTNNSSVFAGNSSAGSAKVYVDSTSNVFAPATNDLTGNISGRCTDNGGPVLSLNGYPTRKAVINGIPENMDSINKDPCINAPFQPSNP